MPAATLLMQRIPARMRILLVLLLAAATIALVIAAAFHGAPVHGHEATSYGGKPDMTFD